MTLVNATREGIRSNELNPRFEMLCALFNVYKKGKKEKLCTSFVQFGVAYSQVILLNYTDKGVDRVRIGRQRDPNAIEA